MKTVKDYDNFGTVVFNTREAAALWNGEIIGQMSDGIWKNSRPANHWKFWCTANVDIKKNSIPHYCFGKKSTDRPTKKSYPIKKLNKEAGIWMLEIVRFAKSRWCTDENVENLSFRSILFNIVNSKNMNQEKIDQVFGNETADEIFEKTFNAKLSWAYREYEKTEHDPEKLKKYEENLTATMKKVFERQVHQRDLIKAEMAEVGIHNYQDLVNANDELNKFKISPNDLYKAEDEIISMFEVISTEQTAI